MKFKWFVSICLVVGLSLNLNGNNGEYETLFQEANALYEKAEFRKAIEIYHKIESENIQSSELFFNLGNAYLESDQIAKSILYFERGFNLDPSDSKMRNNLSIARSKVDTEIIEIPDFLLVRVWRKFTSAFSPIVWNIIQLLLAICLIFSIYKWRFSNTQSEKIKALSFSFLSFTLLTISVFSGMSSVHQANNKSFAILMSDADLKTAPDLRSDDISSVSEGIKIKLIDEIDDWFKVQLMNKEIGWLPKKDITII